tara:strand:- start:993 stop:1268 length:276 start_codon:yes stop_codon:yes gene_type:complete
MKITKSQLKRIIKEEIKNAQIEKGEDEKSKKFVESFPSQRSAAVEKLLKSLRDLDPSWSDHRWRQGLRVALHAFAEWSITANNSFLTIEDN